ncbi:MAG: hypothetical protein HC871_00655 [Rhizobiales bacterium]|nr:hypothetical protein [Hyphomicrobiales bacterium]
MGVVSVDVTAEHLPAIRQLLLHYWERSWPTDMADSFLRWRLFDRPDWAAVAVFDGDRCVAFIDSFVRPYTIDGERVRVRETGEWFCMPDYRPLASLKVLQALMKKPEPIVATTNSEVTKAVLPRLKWQVVCAQQQCIFPVGIGVAVKGLTKRLKMQLSALPAVTGTLLPFRFRKPRRLAAPEQPASVSVITSADDLPDLQPPEDAFALYALADREDARWFSAPRAARAGSSGCSSSSTARPWACRSAASSARGRIRPHGCCISSRAGTMPTSTPGSPARPRAISPPAACTGSRPAPPRT